jgi:hypothetical protein
MMMRINPLPLVMAALVFGAIVREMALQNDAAGHIRSMIWNLIIGGAMFFAACPAENAAVDWR